MIEWTSDALWEKTKLFAARAGSQEQEGTLFPFWSILALELLARTVVANVHPVLLADPQTGENLMYAFGLGELRRPKSVPAKTVFLRCTKIVEDFTDADAAGALGLVDLRNQELHSGGVPFEGLSTGAWLANYYRICELLLRSLGRELEDLFGPEQAGAARQMIAGAAEQLVSEVNEYVATQRSTFNALSAREQTECRRVGATWIKERESEAWAPHSIGKVTACPSCESAAWITGEFVRSGEPVAEEDAIVQEIVKIPTRLECPVCGLDVSGHGRLHALGLGGLFTGQLREDPASYFDIEFDSADLYEPDYGND